MTSNVYVNMIKQGKHVLVACCDSELLGKTLKHGKIVFEVKSSFYGGNLVYVEEAVEALRDATTANLVGDTIVKAAIKEGIVHPKAVTLISGVPHAQIVRV